MKNYSPKEVSQLSVETILRILLESQEIVKQLHCGHGEIPMTTSNTHTVFWDAFYQARKIASLRMFWCSVNRPSSCI